MSAPEHTPDIIKTFQVLHISTRTSSKGTIYQSMDLLDSAGATYKVQVFNPHLWDTWGDTLPREGDYIHIELWKDQQPTGTFLRPITIRAPTQEEIERFKALQAMRAQGSEEPPPEEQQPVHPERQEEPKEPLKLTELPREELLKMAVEQDIAQRSILIRARADALKSAVHLLEPQDTMNPMELEHILDIAEIFTKWIMTGQRPNLEQGVDNEAD